MIQVLVELTVKDFEALAKFESQALAIVSKYNGRLISAFETERMPDGSGEEIHLLEFPNEESLNNYRNDSALANLTSLRESAILATQIKLSKRQKNYVSSSQNT